MTQTLQNFLIGAKNKEFATKTGTQMHAVLQHVIVDDSVGNRGTPEIIKEILNRPNLKPFFTKDAKTEVPIAGFINGHFISRRIDRLIIKQETKVLNMLNQ